MAFSSGSKGATIYTNVDTEYLRSNSTTDLLSNIETVYSIQINESPIAKPPTTNVKRKSIHKEAPLAKPNAAKANVRYFPFDDKTDDNQSINFDLLNEKDFIYGADARKMVAERLPLSDVHKRTQIISRSPISYRFSAGDADKLEKGIKPIPSSRSLREN